MKTSISKINSNKSSSITKELVVANRNGLHARPAALFVKTSNRFQSDVWVEKDGERVNGKSIMGLMMLAASQGSLLYVKAEGSDAAELMAALEKLLSTNFGEE